MKTASLIASVSRNAGGLFESVRRLHQSLLADDLEIDVLAMRDRYTEEDVGAWHPLNVRTFATSGPWQFGYAPQLADSIRKADYDLLHTHGLWMYPSVAVLRWHRRTCRPYIVSPHGMVDPWALRNSRWKKRVAGALFETEHLRRARCIRVLCNSEAESVRRLGLKNPLCVIPNGIDVPIEQPDEKPPWHGRVSSGTKVLLYLGRIHPKKNLPALIEAWATLQRDTKAVREWVIVIAGWDQNNHEAEIREQCRTAGVQTSVIFIGPVFDKAKAAAYHNADAFILPSLSEGLPMVVLEAWAYGKPVIMTRECNLSEGFAAGAATECRIESISIATALTALFSMTNDDRRKMGQRGLVLVRERFTWPVIAQQMREAYQWVLGSGSKPGCFVA